MRNNPSRILAIILLELKFPAQMGTKKIGRGSSNVTINMPKKLADELRALAAESGFSFSAYARKVLAEAARQNVKYQTVKITDRIAAEEQAHFGTKKPSQKSDAG